MVAHNPKRSLAWLLLMLFSTVGTSGFFNHPSSPSSLQQETQLKSMTPEERMLAAFNDFKDEKQQLQAQVSQFENASQLSSRSTAQLTRPDCSEPLASIV
jgi:hypothetical protein